MVSAGLISVLMALLAGKASRSKLEEERRLREAAERDLERLREEFSVVQARLQAVSQGLKMGVSVVGPDLRLIDSCDGPSGGENSDQPCYQRLWNRTEVCEDCPAARAFQSGRPEAGEVTTGTDSSDRQYYQVITSPVRGLDGKVTQVVELARDITERRRIEVQLLQAGKMAALGELAASIAHDINNPLASISAYAEQLADAAQHPALTASPEFKKFPGHLATIRKNVKRCKEITSALLDFARKKEEPVQPVDISMALDETLSLVEHEARQTGKRIERELPDDLPAVLGQRGEFQQVLLNLLTNALDASSPGGVVAVRARTVQGEVAIDIEDRGTGIAPGDRDHVFSPFFTTKPPGKGTGLGLAICSRIVKRMKGRLTFVTEEGVGTTFTVWLGVARLRARQREAA